MIPQMKSWIRVALLIAAVTTASCGKSHRSRMTPVTIEAGTVKRVNGCHVAFDRIIVHPQVEDLCGEFRFACKVEESVLSSKEWWGTQPQPLPFPMSVGDCTLLEKTFYCVVEIDRSAPSVTLKATYDKKEWDGSVIIQHIE